MIQKISLAFVSMALVFSFAGCSSDETATPAAPVTVTEQATPEVPSETPEVPEADPSADEQFAQLVREEAPYFASSPTEDIIYLAETICSAFDQGATFRGVGESIMESGAPAYDSGFVIGASVSYLCPEHEAMIQAQANA